MTSLVVLDSTAMVFVMAVMTSPKNKSTAGSIRSMGGVVAVAAAVHAALGHVGLAFSLRGRTHQRGQVVGQDLGGDIDDECVVGVDPLSWSPDP